MVHLDPSDLADAYRDGQQYAREYHDAYDEFERLARNELNPKLEKTMPRVNDGSLAALMKEVPKRILAQLSTGVITPVDSDEAWLKELTNIIWNKRIVPNANSQMDFFGKYRLWLYRAIVYGGAPAYSYFDGSKPIPSSDFILPEPRNVILEDGKLSDLDSDYIMMEVWYKKRQIKSIISRGKEQDNSTWDLKALSDLISSGEETKEHEKGNSNEYKMQGHKLVAVFQRGHLAPFYMFAPKLGNKVVRTWDNQDPTGNLPITYMYNEQDLVNPYGVSQIALSGPIQNVLDYLTQSFLLATQLGLQPPVKIGGDTSRLSDKSLVLAPRAKWRVGDASVDVVNSNSTTYTQYPNNYGLVKTQLMNLQGTTDASVSSTSGAPGYSKTHAGVQLQEQRTNANDNALRLNSSSAFQRNAQSMFNLHVANSEGSDIIHLYGPDLEKMQKAGLIDTDPETQEPSTEEVEIIWDNIRGEYHFEVDVDSSIGRDDNDQKDKMIEIMTLASQDEAFDQHLLESGWKFNRGEFYKQLVMKVGLNNWEKIIEEMSEDEQKALEAEKQMMEQAMMAQQMGQQPPTAEQAPQMAPQEAELAQLPPETQEQPPNELELALAEVIEQYGIEPQQAMAVLEARQQGIPEEMIVNYLQTGRVG